MSKLPSGNSQRDISTYRDNIGGDQTNNVSNTINVALPISPIAILMQRLADEVKNDQQVQCFIDTLQFYYEHHSHDGINGLENKLVHTDRADEIVMAIRKKELFTRLLAKYGMFESAQQIFAYLLSKVEQDYRVYVLPNVTSCDRWKFDQLIHEHLIEPIITEVSAGVFLVNAAIAAGMVYWLAEQCYVRWHA